MEFEKVRDFGQELFDHYSKEKETGERFLFAKALQNNPQLCGEVQREFFFKLEEVCRRDNHQGQKLAFRGHLLDSIKNMIMWQEFFKREGSEEVQVIYSFLKDSFKTGSQDEFEKQVAYFQLYSEAQFSLLQGILNRFYDEVFENNYSAMLIKLWRLYYKYYFNFIVAKVQNQPYVQKDVLDQLTMVARQVENSAMDGEELTYNLEGF